MIPPLLFFIIDYNIKHFTGEDLETVWICVLICVLLNFEFFFLLKLSAVYTFLDRFDVLMLKIILKK